jgi:hypothetical protein
MSESRTPERMEGIVKMEDIDGGGKGGAAYEARGRVFESPWAHRLTLNGSVV